MRDQLIKYEVRVEIMRSWEERDKKLERKRAQRGKTTLGKNKAVFPHYFFKFYPFGLSWVDPKGKSMNPSPTHIIVNQAWVGTRLESGLMWTQTTRLNQV